MSVSVSVNFLSVIHAGSNGISPCFPDICQTPSPAGPIPIPYPNIAKSSDSGDTAKKVLADGEQLCVQGSNFSVSTGDEAGSIGGVASGKCKGKAEFVNYSFDVKAEGKNVPRAFDLMLHNDKNTPPFPVLQGPAVAVGGRGCKECVCCGEEF
jgi:hypothetical protein